MRRRNVLFFFNSPSLFSFFFFLFFTRGRIPAAVGGRCTWQDNKTCSASFGPLPVSTVGCEWSVNRVLIVVGRFWFIAVSKPRENRGRFCILAGRPHSAPACQWFLVRSRKNPVIQSGWIDGAASTVHMLHHSVLFPNRMQMCPKRVAHCATAAN